MTKTYTVAGHSFRFDIPKGNPLLEQLGQYAPFESPKAADPIFTVEVVKELPELALTQVYGGAEEPGQPVVILYRSGSDWAYDMHPMAGYPASGRVVADSAFTHARLKVLDPSQALFALNNAAMLMFAFRTAGLGTLEMHASVIVNGGRAFLWLARSGTGKSTHSRLWLEHVPGSRLLNDDNPIVRVNPDGSVEVYGSPWSGKTPCYKNEHYPAGAFVRIVRSPENRIEKLGVLDSYALIYSSSSGFKTDPLMADQLHSTFEKILSATPCYSLYCRPDEEAARVSSAKLLEP